MLRRSGRWQDAMPHANRRPASGTHHRSSPCCNPADITEHWLPRWLAPNLITLMGLFALLWSYVLGMMYLPEFAGDAPRWFYFAR